MLSDQAFRLKADEALDRVRRELLPLADAEGFEVELQNDVLDVVFEGPREVRFVVSPNSPMRQIWLSAMAKSYKLSWSEGDGTFVLGGETLSQLLERLVQEFLSGRR
jgi:CyaY protein